MRWLLENPQLLFIIGGAVAFWLNQRRKQKQDREMAEEAAREPTDEEMLERTRRIQEEIRRKIEERQGRSPVAEEPVLREAPPPLPVRPVVVAHDEAPGAAELARVMEQQRRYAEELEQLAAAERARAGAFATPAAPMTMAAYAMAAPTERRRRRTDSVFAMARDRDSLRRAIVLREVLGAPKALG